TGATDAQIAAWLADVLTKGLARVKGDIAICLPGGSTPFPILAELARFPLDWARIVVWPGDDRIVDESHSASNVGRMRAVLEPLGARIRPLARDAVPPHFALVWLGMGEDGHIASLFPNSNPQVDDPMPMRRLTPDPLPVEAPFDRLSLTIPALLDCDALMFVMRGAVKQRIFAAAVAGENDLPVARLLAAARQPIAVFAGG
ncbi:MAG: hypothetical protein RLY97_7, partial [Pseudomonadota bacterium]